ncbi:MAG: hypothetical protein ACOCUN_01160 [Jiangellaceae bacterium]
MRLPTLTFEVAFGVNPLDTVDTADWIDLSDRLRPPRRTGRVAHVSRGRRHEDDAADAGTCQVWLDNADRELDPSNENSSWWPDVLPLRPCRLTATHDGTSWPLFRGFVERWPTVTTSHHDSHVAVAAIDGRKLLGRIDLETVDLDRQLSGERINAVLDAAGWPADLRAIDDGVVILLPLQGDEINAAAAIEDAAAAEDGLFYFDADGVATFHDRHHRLDAPSPDLVFGPDGGGQIDLPELELPYDDEGLINRARVERRDAKIFRFADDTSIDRYGERNAGGLDIEVPEREAVAWADWTVNRYAEPLRRPPPLPIDAYQDASVFAAAVGLELSDRVGLVHRPPGGGDPIDLPMVLEGVEHDIATAAWQVEVDLSPYFGAGPWFRLDDDVLGVLGDDAGNKLAP